MFEYKVKFEDFKQECEKFYWGFKNNGRHKFHDLRIYESLPYDETKKDFPERWYPKYWFIFAFEEHRHFILTCNAKTGYSEVYVDEYTVLGEDGFGYDTPTQGMTQRVDFGADFDRALGRICFWLPGFERRQDRIRNNQTYFIDLNHTQQWKDGDTPFDQDYNNMSFLCALDKVLEAKRSHSGEFKGMHIYMSAEGWFGYPDYSVHL